MSAAVIVTLILGLLPYIEKAIEWLIARRQNGQSLRPGQQRRMGVLMHHIGRLRDSCEQLQAHGQAIGCVAQAGEIGDDEDDDA